jgi:VanZ family protein
VTRLFFRYWLPLLAWTAMIFMASTDVFSAPHTESVIQTIIAAIIGHPLPPEKFPLHFVIRKLAHLTEYAILGALAFRAVRAEERGWSARSATIAIAIAFLIAASDEFHQSFVPSRTPSPVDVAIDTVGAAIAQGIIRWRVRPRRIPVPRLT